ncbi:pectinesterase family protein [Flavobacterium sp. RHBU_3]|uniref:pectinesterase family protein n=1 Tax=Flavobacterium sp. RHBU_3 TaxID=3391184 RepID=UPI003984CC87
MSFSIFTPKKAATKMILLLAFLSFSMNCFAADERKVVALDGSGDYTSIQQAINNSKAFPYHRITIYIKNGVYHEKVKVHEWNSNITLEGESIEGTIISYDDYFNKINLGPNSTFYTSTLLVEGDNFIAKNITVENTAGEVGQAVALSLHANNAAVINCKLLGNQDTLYVTGNGFKNYFKDCFIQGTTDFIFGSATAYFDNCTLHSLRDSYITAASTPQGEEYGFVFSNCTLTAESGATKVYLGRPWRIYAKTVFINCNMAAHILPEGWQNWSKPDAEKNSFYAEYNNTGSGFTPKRRVAWSHQLTAKEAKNYTIEKCMGMPFYNVIKTLTTK